MSDEELLAAAIAETTRMSSKLDQAIGNQTRMFARLDAIQVQIERLPTSNEKSPSRTTVLVNGIAISLSLAAIAVAVTILILFATQALK